MHHFLAQVGIILHITMTYLGAGAKAEAEAIAARARTILYMVAVVGVVGE